MRTLFGVRETSAVCRQVSRFRGMTRLFALIAQNHDMPDKNILSRSDGSDTSAFSYLLFVDKIYLNSLACSDSFDQWVSNLLAVLI
jgi:hypothetical protein